jgi:hypothetical protein
MGEKGGCHAEFPHGGRVTYSLEFTPDLAEPFGPVDTVTGDGTTANFTRALESGKGFYRVSPPPPGN